MSEVSRLCDEPANDSTTHGHTTVSGSPAGNSPNHAAAASVTDSTLIASPVQHPQTGAATPPEAVKASADPAAGTPTAAATTAIINAPRANPGGSNVFVASLPATLDDKELAELFAPFGSVVSAKVSRDLATGSSKLFGFVLFSDPASAAKAIEALDGTRVRGLTSKLHVTLARQSEEGTAAESDRLYIRNLPSAATAEDLQRIFSVYGSVVEANVLPNRGAGGRSQPSAPSQTTAAGAAHMGVGFVRMASIDEARAAIAGVHNTRPLDPQTPILVRFMESADGKAARRMRNVPPPGPTRQHNAHQHQHHNHHHNHHAQGASAHQHPHAPHIVDRSPPSSADLRPVPGSPTPWSTSVNVPASPYMFLQHTPAQIVPSAPFPVWGDLYVTGAATEQILVFVFQTVQLQVMQALSDGRGFFVRLANASAHETAVQRLHNAQLSDGNRLLVSKLVPPSPMTVAQPHSPTTHAHSALAPHAHGPPTHIPHPHAPLRVPTHHQGNHHGHHSVHHPSQQHQPQPPMPIAGATPPVHYYAAQPPPAFCFPTTGPSMAPLGPSMGAGRSLLQQ